MSIYGYYYETLFSSLELLLNICIHKGSIFYCVCTLYQVNLFMVFIPSIYAISCNVV